MLAVLPPLLFGQSWSDWIERGLTFLVVSCPCALVISVPLSFFGGIGGASRLGILVKGGNYLEALSHTETVVFDKTGTLTNGSFNVVAVHPDAAAEVDPDLTFPSLPMLKRIPIIPLPFPSRKLSRVKSIRAVLLMFARKAAWRSCGG